MDPCLGVFFPKNMFTCSLFTWVGIQGGTRMARGGIRLVHGLTKSTLIIYFSCMKIDPKYAFLHAFFLNLPVMSFPKFVYMTKNTPFFRILHVFFSPLNDVHAFLAWSWKTTLITWIFGRVWYPPLTFECPPGAGMWLCNLAPMHSRTPLFTYQSFPIPIFAQRSPWVSGTGQNSKGSLSEKWSEKLVLKEVLHP